MALEVKFGTLDAFGQRFNNVALRASADAARLVGEREAPTSSRATSRTATPSGGRLVARLARFTIPADTPGAGRRPAAPAPKPSELPAIDLVAEEFTFRGKQLGRVELVAQPRRRGLAHRIARAW